MQAFSCLMYHNVCEDLSLQDPQGEWSDLSPSIKSYFVEKSVFAAHLAAMQRTVDLITLEQVRNFFSAPNERERGKQQLDVRPSTLLTFDDGWGGTLDLAVPILRKYAAEATVFITTNLLNTPGFLRASELCNLPPQLQIGSHCRTHRFLNELSTAEIREELRHSKLELERLSGRPVDTVAIPNGAVDDRVRDIAIELGYSLVFTSELQLNSRWTGPRQIGRAAIRSSTPASIAVQYAEGDYGIEPIRRMALALPKRLLGPERYRKIRAWLIGEKSSHKEMHDLCPSEPIYEIPTTVGTTTLENSAAEASLPY